MGSSGDAGTIAIDANSLKIEGVGSVDVNSFNGSSGDAGKIVIHGGSLTIDGTGSVGARTFNGSTGNGGNVVVDADTVQIGGRATGGPGAGVFRSVAIGGTRHARAVHGPAQGWDPPRAAGAPP